MPERYNRNPDDRAQRKGRLRIVLRIRKKITVSRFLADSKTANKLLDQIGEIYRKGKMQSSTEIVLDAGTYSIDVDFHGFHVETEGCFSFPEWSEPIIESIRTIFRDCCNGLRPGILYNR